jgi:hypothetical protein
VGHASLTEAIGCQQKGIAEAICSTQELQDLADPFKKSTALAREFKSEVQELG